MNNDVKPASGPAERAAKAITVSDADTDTNTTDFKTPEQVAAVDDVAAPDDTRQTQPSTSDPVAPETRRSIRQRLGLQWPPTKKEYLIGGGVVLILLLATSAFALTHASKPAPVATTHKAPAKPKPAPKPTTVPSTLTGLPVDPAVNQRPVTAAMIENSLDARPQSGLSQAGVVFEAIAEGGVTRFMAVFQDNLPTNIGPIRSARPYYVSWAKGFDAGYAHVGGSPDGLADIRAWGVRDLDQFYNAGAYHRIDSRDAPHNVYTGVDTLMALSQSKGFTSSTYTGFARKAAAPSATPNAKSLDFTLSGYYYNPHFDYDAASNTYKRSEAGAPQIDQNSGAQLSPNVVVAIVTPLGQGELDSSGAYYSDYTVVGSGQAFVFQDGIVTIGTWNKPSNDANISFSDSAGKPLPLNPGQTWITAVSSADKVSYNP